MFILTSVILTVIFLSTSKPDLCGHKYTRTGLRVAFEYPDTHRFDFDFKADSLFKKVLKIDGVISGWQRVGHYSFNIDVCPTCNRKEIIKNVELEIVDYIQNRFCD